MKKRFIGSTIALVVGGLLALAGLGEFGRKIDSGPMPSGPSNSVDSLTMAAMVMLCACAYRSRKRRKLALVPTSTARVALEYVGLWMAAAAIVLHRDLLDLVFEAPIAVATPLWGWTAYAMAGLRTHANRDAQHAVRADGTQEMSAAAGTVKVFAQPVPVSRVLLGVFAAGALALLGIGGFIRLQQGGAFGATVSADGTATRGSERREYVMPRLATVGLLNDRFELSYDSAKWKLMPSNEPGMQELHHMSGNAMVKVISEPVAIPREELKRIVVENAEAAASDVKVLGETLQVINGLDVARIRFAAVAKGMKVTFFNQMHSDESGTIQMAAWAGTSSFDAYESDFQEVFGGLRRSVSARSAASGPSTPQAALTSAPQPAAERPAPRATPKAPWRKQSNWRLLSRGMPQSTVAVILGEPGRVVHNEFFTKWYYGYPSGGEVTFDANGKVDAWSEP